MMQTIQTKSLAAAILIAVAQLMISGSLRGCSASADLRRIVSADPDDDSTESLRRLAEGAIRAARAGDESKLMQITSAMVLPNPEQWFGTVFGDSARDTLGAEYGKIAGQIPSALARDFDTLAAEKVSDVGVVRFSDSCGGSADETIYPILSARRTPAPLALLKFGRSNEAKTLRFFAYSDGEFRYVGKLERAAQLEDQVRAPANAPRVIRDAKVTAANRIDHVVPEYPRDARLEHIQGTVKIHVIIAQDGSVRNARVLSGPCILAEAALKAVKQFRYAPVTVDGTPVETDSTVVTVFTLGG